MKHFPDLPPIWALAFAIVAVLVGKFAPLMSFDAPRWIALLPIAVGFALIVWSALFFWRQKTTIEPHHTPTSLIVDGPYRFSRNPIYLGMFLGLFGVVLWSGALSAVLISFGFPLVISRRFIAQEEAALTKAFGAEADIYLARTHRWIGLLTKT